MTHSSRSTAAHAARRAALAIAGLAVAFALIVPSVASAAAFSLNVKFPKSNPVMKKNWPISWTATKGSQKLSGYDQYQFYFGNTLESTQKGVKFSGGAGHDTLVFPAEAVGHPLKLRVMVITKYGTASAWTNLTTQK
jgi:hypothetical protein